MFLAHTGHLCLSPVWLNGSHICPLRCPQKTLEEPLERQIGRFCPGRRAGSLTTPAPSLSKGMPSRTSAVFPTLLPAPRTQLSGEVDLFSRQLTHSRSKCQCTGEENLNWISTAGHVPAFPAPGGVWALGEKAEAGQKAEPSTAGNSGANINGRSYMQGWAK